MAAEQPERYTANDGEGGPARPDLRRLPAQPHGCDGRGRLLDARSPRRRCLDRRWPGTNSGPTSARTILPSRTCRRGSHFWTRIRGTRCCRCGSELPSVPEQAKPKRRSSKAAAANVRAAPEENILWLLPGAVAPPKSELTAYWQKVGKGCSEASRAAAPAARPPCRGQDVLSRRPAAAVPDAVHELRDREARERQGTLALGRQRRGHPRPRRDRRDRTSSVGSDHRRHRAPRHARLQPRSGARRCRWPFVIETALRLRELLRTEGLESWPKLTGGKSVHVMVPVEPDLDWDEAHDYCRDIAERLAATRAGSLLDNGFESQTGRPRAHRLAAKRPRQCTALGAYSPRALPGFPVAAPVTWKQLEAGIATDAFTLKKPPPAQSADSERALPALPAAPMFCTMSRSRFRCVDRACVNDYKACVADRPSTCNDPRSPASAAKIERGTWPPIRIHPRRGISPITSTPSPMPSATSRSAR